MLKTPQPRPGRKYRLGLILLALVLAALACAAPGEPGPTPTAVPGGGEPTPTPCADCPPVVLVHGFQGLNFDLTGGEYTCDRDAPENDIRPYTGGTGEKFAELAGWLASDGYDVWIAEYTTGPVIGTPRLEENAACLAAQIGYVYGQTGGQEITVIAHSMGGVVSRIALTLLEASNPGGNVVARLITLGTPHAGIPDQGLARLLPDCFNHPGACQLAESNMLARINRDYPNLESVRYAFIGGDGGFGFFSWFLKVIGSGDNDGVSGNQSAVGWYPFDPDRGLSAWTGDLWGRFWTDEAHSSNAIAPYYYGSSAGRALSHAYACISAALENGLPDPALCPAVGQPPPVLEFSTLPRFQSTEVQSGVLTGTAAVVTITVDADIGRSGFTDPTANLAFSVVSQDSDLSFALIDPAGRRIDPDAAGVRFESTPGTAETPASATVRFLVREYGAEGLGGAWTLEISGAAGTAYEAFAVLESTRGLSLVGSGAAGRAAGVDQAGDTVVFSVELTDAGTRETSAGVDVFARCPAGAAPGEVAPTAALAQSDGTFAVVCPELPGPGIYRITVVARDALTGFSRQVDLIVDTTPPTGLP